MDFTSNDGSQNTFLYQPTLHTLDKGTDIFLVGNQRDYKILNLSHILLFYVALNFLDIELE